MVTLLVRQWGGVGTKKAAVDEIREISPRTKCLKPRPLSKYYFYIEKPQKSALYICQGLNFTVQVKVKASECNIKNIIR